MSGSKADTPKPKSRIRRLAEVATILVLALLASITVAPQTLAWPYHQRIGATDIYSEAPIGPRMNAILARAGRLLAQSPLHARLDGHKVFLTDGGWRWSLLALSSRSAFAFRRPFRDSVIVNRSDVAADRVYRASTIAGVRTLSGTLAHEFTHILVARHLGEMRAAFLPTWKSEGFADFVSQESSLSEADYRRLKAEGKSSPAITYYEGRRRVEAELRRGGGVDALFAW